MKKLLFVLAIIAAGISLAEEQPPYEVTSPAISENFRQIYYQNDELKNTTVKYKDSTRHFNVKDYGAKGNGSTDDAAIIQSVINIASTTGGGTVYFPCGTYMIGTSIVVYSSTTLMGAAYGCVVIKAKDFLNDRLVQNQARLGAGTDYNINFENLIFDMNGANVSADSTSVTIIRVKGHVVRNCTFRNPYDSTYLLAGSNDVNDNSDALYENVSFLGTNQSQPTDVVDIGNAQHVTLRNCRVFDAKVGSGQAMLSIAAINDFNVIDSILDGNFNGAPISIFGVNGGKLDGNEIKNSAEAGIRYNRWTEGTPDKDFENFSIVNNNIHDNTWYGIWARQDTSPFDTPKNVNISNNKIWNNGRNAFEIEVASGLIINNNFVFSNSKSGAGSYYAAEFIQAGSNQNGLSNISVQYNIFSDTQAVKTQTKIFQLSYVNGFHSSNNQFLNTVTTYTVVAGTTNNIKLTDGDANYYIGSLSRDLSLAGGNVVYTGTDFTPTAIDFLQINTSNYTTSWGFDDGSRAHSVIMSASGVTDSITGYSIYVTDPSQSNRQRAYVSSFGLNQFTLTWEKTGSPSGTAVVKYKAQR